MSLLRITANKAEYKDGHVLVTFSLGEPSPYAKFVEVKNLKDVEAAVLEARAAVAGTNAAISIFIRGGRKPNGFDAWKAANLKLLFVEAA